MIKLSWEPTRPIWKQPQLQAKINELTQLHKELKVLEAEQGKKVSTFKGKMPGGTKFIENMYTIAGGLDTRRFNTNDKLSASKLIEYLKSGENIAAGDSYINGRQYLELLKFVMSMPRSYFLDTYSQTSASEYSVAVPLVLAGLKRDQNIQYEKWDKEDPKLEYLFGSRGASSCVNVLPNNTLGESGYNLETYTKLLKSPDFGIHRVNSYGKKSIGSYGCNKSARCMDRECIPVVVGMQLYQLWVYNVDSRNEYIILDPLNWDNIPEPLDAPMAERNTVFDYSGGVLATKAKKIVVEDDFEW